MKQDIEQPLLKGADSAVQPANKGKVTLDRARAVLMPRRKLILAIQAACVLFYVVALFNMHSGTDAPAAAGLSKRTVINGSACVKQKKQINVFMASFWTGFLAIDQFYAHNWQLAVPKLLFFILGGPISLVTALFTGFSLHFAWWLIDVVMWGVGFYTTDTKWGNPTQGCAVKGW